MPQSNTAFTVIMPARLASTRLPNKLCEHIAGKSILEHSYLAALSSRASRVIIAADSNQLFTLAESFGAEAILTRDDHESGTDRLAECAQILALDDDEIIVNLQADEPFMPPEYLANCADGLVQSQTAVSATLAAPINDDSDIVNPHSVKVVCDNLGHALYFSRAPIPYNRDSMQLNLAKHYFHHLGIYAYRAGFLSRYQHLSICPLEQIEKLEQLRILWHGYKMAVTIVKTKPPKGIDTAEDLANARAYRSL